jgi:hypothetical protein
VILLHSRENLVFSWLYHVSARHISHHQKQKFKPCQSPGHSHECKYKKARSYGTYYIKMLLSTNIHCIEAKYRTRKSRESDIKLQFQESHNSITWAIHPAKQTHWYTDKEKHNIERNITLIRRVSPLEVSTTSFVSVTAWRYNPAKKKTKNKNQTPKKHYYYRIGKNKIKSCKSLNDYKATYYIQNQTIERKHKTIEEKRNVTKAK